MLFELTQNAVHCNTSNDQTLTVDQLAEYSQQDTVRQKQLFT